jgi:hypothetical protein
MLTADVYKPGSTSVVSNYRLDNKQDVCECSISGIPQEKWFSRNTATSDMPINSVNVVYELINTEKIKDKELKVKVQRSIYTTGEPRFVVGNEVEKSTIIYGSNDSEYYLQWTYDIELQDRSNTIEKPDDNPGISIPNDIDLSPSGYNFNLKANMIYNPLDRSRYKLVIRTSIPLIEAERGRITDYATSSFAIPIKARIRRSGGEMDFVINNVTVALPKFEKSTSTSPK